MGESAQRAIADAKLAARKELLSQRRRLAPARGSAAARELAAAVAERVDAFLAAIRPGYLGLYAPLEGELDPEPIGSRAASRGFALCYPRIESREPPSLSFRVARRDELVPATFGLLEPTAAAPTADPLSALVVPGVGFDESGQRLGFGRGYYDVALSARPSALRIGVGYDFQLVPALPSGALDEAMDLVVTPSRCLVSPSPREAARVWLERYGALQTRSPFKEEST